MLIILAAQKVEARGSQIGDQLRLSVNGETLSQKQKNKETNKRGGV
jgi:hypothetical protein